MSDPVKVFTFTGINGIGTITVTGLKTGDIVLKVIPVSGTGVALGSDSSSVFSLFIASDNTMFQNSTGDFSGVTFAILIERRVVM